MNKFYIIWFYVSMTIIGGLIGMNLKSRRAVEEIGNNAIYISKSSINAIDELVDYIGRRFDDLTKEEIDRLSDIVRAVNNVKADLARTKHRL